MPYADRRDANDSALTKIARQCGALVVKMRPGQGCDLLIVHRGRVLIVEIKDGAKPHSARKLTKQEQGLKDQCEYRGVPYYIVESEEDLLRLLGA